MDRYAHLVGGARMGFEPDDSVVDRDHRVWGVPNLFVVDGSVLPTQGAANPALVIMALADRFAGLLRDKRVGPRERSAGSRASTRARSPSPPMGPNPTEPSSGTRRRWSSPL